MPLIKFAELVRYIDIALTVTFIIVFARVIRYLYSEIKSSHKELLKCVKGYAEKLEKRDKESSETTERLRQSLDMLTTAIINNNSLGGRSVKGGEEDA